MYEKNISNVSLPPEWLLNIYFWYSHLTLAITWLITPLLLYVVFKESKNMKAFKWLILNHSFWCLAFETLFATVKPIFFGPAIAGFPLGFLRNGNFRSSAILALVGLSCCTNSITALIATLLSRYLLAFPLGLANVLPGRLSLFNSIISWFFSKFLSLKFFVFITVFLTVAVYGVLGVIFYLSLNIDEETVRAWAIEYDPFFQNFTEPGFFFVPHEYADFALSIILFLFALLFIGAIILSAFFIYLVKSRKTLSVAKLQRSLIISCIAQIWLLCIFLCTPVIMFLCAFYFQIPHSGSSFLIFYFFVVTHSLLEFISTLYFVSPYRRRVVKLFYSVLSYSNVHHRQALVTVIEIKSRKF